MNFLNVSAASQIAEAELFFGALYLYSIYWEWQSYSLPCLFLNFASVMILCQLLIPRYNTLSMKFSWWRGGGGVLHIFQFFLSRVVHRGGMGRLPSCEVVFIRYGWKRLDGVKLKSPSNYSCSKFSFSFLFILL